MVLFGKTSSIDYGLLTIKSIHFYKIELFTNINFFMKFIILNFNSLAFSIMFITIKQFFFHKRGKAGQTNI